MIIMISYFKICLIQKKLIILIFINGEEDLIYNNHFTGLFINYKKNYFISKIPIDPLSSIANKICFLSLRYIKSRILSPI